MDLREGWKESFGTLGSTISWEVGAAKRGTSLAFLFAQRHGAGSLPGHVELDTPWEGGTAATARLWMEGERFAKLCGVGWLSKATDWRLLHCVLGPVLGAPASVLSSEAQR